MENETNETVKQIDDLIGLIDKKVDSFNRFKEILLIIRKNETEDTDNS